ncbi:MAG TPA: histidine kinase dimerization/phospho-acceptor domain-containing protein, partial [Chthonomonadales bacterium]|nr:histidine kinase dimerization/phospho-acceptor domain-containing protein [Chthonomonadales bacterium]
MAGKVEEAVNRSLAVERGGSLLWLCGLWTLPLLELAQWALPATYLARGTAAAIALLLAPLPAIVIERQRRQKMHERVATTEEAEAQLRLQLDTVRYQTARLREELQAADTHARLSHQLTLLGQFTAGFMHEFNNPLAIVAGRLEVLLDERKEDATLCADLEQMLKEARYMGKIAGTLLQALRRERGGEVFESSIPEKAMEEALGAFRPSTEAQGVRVMER